MDRLRELIASLDARGIESPYLERLRRSARGSGAARGQLDALRQEILAEMAASLGRAEDRINEALLECQLLGSEIDELERQVARGRAPAGALDEKLTAFARAREHAERRVWELTVQREALGLRHNDSLGEHYPIPPARRRRT